MRNEDLKEIIEVQYQATRAELKANADILHMLHDQVDKQNSRVRKLECKVEKNTIWRKTIIATGSALVAILSFLFTKISSILSALR